MAYSAWIRSLVWLRNAAICLGVVLVLAAIARFTVGNQGMVDVQGPGMHTVIMGRPDVPVDVAIPFGIALFVGLVVATILGGPLGRENANHLEIVWTKPVSRIRYAFAAMTADLTAILASQLLAVAVIFLCILLFTTPHFYASGDSGVTILRTLLGPVAWYAMYVGLTSWLKRGRGAVLGLSWAAALILPGVTLIGAFPGSPPLAVIAHYVFSFLNFFNPLRYAQMANGHGAALIAPSDPWYSVGILCLLIVGYTAAGLIEWQRVEA